MSKAAARQLRVEDHEGLVRVVARRFRWACASGKVDEEDLLQAGRMGLMKAIEKFDATRGVKFSTYAVFWVLQGIRREVQNCERTVRVPVNSRSRRDGTLPAAESSLDAPAPGGGSWLDGFASDAEPPDRALERKELATTVNAALARLPVRDRQVLRERILRGRTLSDLAPIFGVSRERVRQIQRSASADLRADLEGIER